MLPLQACSATLWLLALVMCARDGCQLHPHALVMCALDGRQLHPMLWPYVRLMGASCNVMPRGSLLCRWLGPDDPTEVSVERSTYKETWKG